MERVGPYLSSQGGAAVRSVALVFALLGAAAGASWAQPKPGTTMVYTIHHEDYGDIGEHRVTFTQNGDHLIVDVENKVEVKLLTVTAFRFEAKRQELWQGDQMVSYRSFTHDDGRDIAVTGEVVGDRFVIDAPSGRIEASPGTFPTHPWNKAIAAESILMDTKTGELLNVNIANLGEETIQAGGEEIEATKYQVTGDAEREVWFDSEDNWVRLRFIRDGSAITFTLDCAAEQKVC